MNFSTLCANDNIHNYNFFNTNDSCQFVQKYCQDEPGNRIFLGFYFCDINQNYILMTIISIIFVSLAFKFISSTAEEYLEPALTRCAQEFNFSESFAGVTLIALANGAPDIIASFTAAKSIDAIPLTIGALFGSGLFTTTIVLSACIISVGKLHANGPILIRDVGFYLIGVLYIILFAVIGQITFFSCIGFYLLYIMFIIFVLKHERMINQLKKNDKGGSLNMSHNNLSNLMDSKSKNIDSIMKNLPGIITHQQFIEETIKSDKAVQQVSKNNTTIDLPVSNLAPPPLYKRLCHIMSRSLSVLINYPFYLCREFTIPYSDDDKWNKKIAIVQPFSGALFVIFSLNLFSFMILHIWTIPVTILICSMFSIYIWKIGDNEGIPEKLLPFYVFASFIISCMWIHFIISLLMNFLEFINIISGLPMNFIALTLLAWGNSMNDFFVDLAIAKKGLTVTALSGIFAGQFFNLMIGLGTSLMRQVFLFGEFEFNFLNGDTTSYVDTIIILGLATNLSEVLAYGLFFHFKLEKKFTIYLIGFYLIVIGSVTGLTFHSVVN